MYSKEDIRNNRGITKIQIIIIVVVVLLLIGAGVAFFILSKSKTPQPINEQDTTQALQDNDTTITTEEKNYIKYHYLDKVSILVSNMYSTQSENTV